MHIYLSVCVFVSDVFAVGLYAFLQHITDSLHWKYSQNFFSTDIIVKNFTNSLVQFCIFFTSAFRWDVEIGLDVCNFVIICVVPYN
jgi:hypothetical protein